MCIREMYNCPYTSSVQCTLQNPSLSRVTGLHEHIKHWFVLLYIKIWHIIKRIDFVNSITTYDELVLFQGVGILQTAISSKSNQIIYDTVLYLSKSRQHTERDLKLRHRMTDWSYSFIIQRAWAVESDPWIFVIAWFSENWFTQY